MSTATAINKQPRPQTIERNKSLQNRFNELYNKKKLRYDYVIEKLAKEFFLSECTVGKVLKSQTQ